MRWEHIIYFRCKNKKRYARMRLVELEGSVIHRMSWDGQLKQQYASWGIFKRRSIQISVVSSRLLRFVLTKPQIVDRFDGPSGDAMSGSLVGRQRYGDTVEVSGIQAGTTRTIVYCLPNDLHWSRV